PHIGLATVTYLFEGEIVHRDSLGTLQSIRPGDVNWMTAGMGIVHSERTPSELRATGSRIFGIQLWVGLPASDEEVAPAFQHLPAARLPLLAGEPLDGERFVWWNFVSSRRNRIAQAAADWKAGRFARVPGETESIPLPDNAPQDVHYP